LIRSRFFISLFLLLRRLITIDDRFNCVFCGRSPSLCAACWVVRARLVMGESFKYLSSVVISDYRFGKWLVEL